MTDSKRINTTRSNVVLFPKTHDYYQIELTRMLETERYGEAISLLRFLLQCGGELEQHRAEWQALLDWLEKAFPYSANDDAVYDGYEDEGELDGNCEAIDAEDEEEAEHELVRQRLQAKIEADDQYLSRLLNGLREGPLDDRKLLMLEQLVHAEDAQLNGEMKHMLETELLHPILQFGILQTLKRRDMTGRVTFKKGNDSITVHIEDTPLNAASFPTCAYAPAEQVHKHAAVSEPSLAYFAQELWQQFLKAIYGSPLYEQLCQADEGHNRVWAAALHRIVAGLLHLSLAESDVKNDYHINGDLIAEYERALRLLSRSLSGGEEAL
ncbi:hypothetical protein KIK04_04545 [Paenibacillus sp. 481]|nr:hypothetical protein KIK04_04545 [Paenibacillus sp. 481]